MASTLSLSLERTLRIIFDEVDAGDTREKLNPDLLTQQQHRSVSYHTTYHDVVSRYLLNLHTQRGATRKDIIMTRRES